MNRTCPHCGDLNGAKAEHCTSCGYQIVLTVTKTVVENIRTCRLCGKSLRGTNLQTRFCSRKHQKKHWRVTRSRTQTA